MSASQSLSHSPTMRANDFVDEDISATPEPIQSSFSSGSPITRTVAIIKTHALQHRFDIEKRILETSFEIVKERQMEFDTETDPETLYELFGEDADSLAEGPVWVYVLERRRAVEVWNTLMGERDVQVARRDSPNCLRALYGLSYEQNGLMGSPDTQTAEIQISSLFASSPPFPTTELPPSDDSYEHSHQEVSAALLQSLRQTSFDDEGYAPSSATNPSTLNGGSSTRLNQNGKPAFKARPLPATHDKPSIVPRMTKAAALRIGQPIEKTVSKPRSPVSKERLAQTFANVPGHKRSSTIAVASTAAPAIAPRMTRAASLRLGQPPAPAIVRSKSLNTEGQASTFEGVPGHKRRESIAVASSRAPTIAPRLNKSAALRQQPKDQAPPSSFMTRGSNVNTAKPSLSRSSSISSLSPLKPVRPPSQASANAPPSRYAVARRPSSSAGQITPKASATSKAPVSKPSVSNSAAPEPRTAPRPSSVISSTVKSRPRPSSIAAPSIAPRTNKAAALRQAKKEEEAAAAAAAAAKAATRKAPRPSKAAPPSSFKAVTT